jgi:hypothetical protein
MRQLTQQQLKAASALSRGLSQTKAAELAGVARRSVVRWLTDPLFTSEVEALKAERSAVQVELVQKIVIQEDVSLKDLLPKALATVKEILDNPDAKNCDRLRAASLICDWSGVKAAAQNKLEEQSFPGSDMLTLDGGVEIDLSSLSDEELNRLYLEKLPGGSR